MADNLLSMVKLIGTIQFFSNLYQFVELCISCFILKKKTLNQTDGYFLILKNEFLTELINVEVKFLYVANFMKIISILFPNKILF